MFTFPNIRVATIDGQPLYPYDVVSFDHATAKDLKLHYMVYYDERMFAFNLIPLSGAAFPILPLDYIDSSIHSDMDWEYHWPADEFTELTIAWPHDTFIENLIHYLKLHFAYAQ